SLLRRGSVSKGKLLFFIDQLQRPFWSPASLAGKPGLQINIRLEASNTTDHAFRIMAVRNVGWNDAITAFCGVQDLQSEYYGHDYPIPAHQIVKVNAHFIFRMPPPENLAKEIKGKLELVDHNARKHRIRFAARGPRSHQE